METESDGVPSDAAPVAVAAAAAPAAAPARDEPPAKKQKTDAFINDDDSD